MRVLKDLVEAADEERELRGAAEERDARVDGPAGVQQAGVGLAEDGPEAELQTSGR